MRLVLLGPPGAGKGTQGQYLTERLGIPRISTGDMLRDAAESGSALGLEAKRSIDHGQLVPDEMALALVKTRLEAPDAVDGYLLDGFPRTVRQAERFEKWLDERNEKLDLVVDLEVSVDEIIRRISNRRVCPACHESYHMISRPPRRAEICDACGNGLVQREDDRAEVVRERLRQYHSRTEPVINYYRDRSLLVAIPGEQTVERITEAIVAAVDQARGR